MRFAGHGFETLVFLRLQVFQQYLLSGLEYIDRTYFGLFGAPGFGRAGYIIPGSLACGIIVWSRRAAEIAQSEKPLTCLYLCSSLEVANAASVSKFAVG